MPDTQFNAFTTGCKIDAQLESDMAKFYESHTVPTIDWDLIVDDDNVIYYNYSIKAKSYEVIMAINQEPDNWGWPEKPWCSEVNLYYNSINGSIGIGTDKKFVKDAVTAEKLSYYRFYLLRELLER